MSNEPCDNDCRCDECRMERESRLIDAAVDEIQDIQERAEVLKAVQDYHNREG